jgi:endonuclease/exonuclease/phosphatase family metal-dependent hydrolase
VTDARRDTRRVGIASYNVHRCIGRDGRHDPARIATVLAELDVDVVGLQEVHCRQGVAGDVDQLAYLAAAGGFTAVSGPTIPTARGHCGNALLTRHPVHAVRRIDLSVADTERRGALDVELDCGGVRLRVIVTHLGLLGRYRRAQVAMLMDLVPQTADGPVVLLGDFNEWLPVAGTLRRLHARFGRPDAGRSFPARLPVFALDRIWMEPAGALDGFSIHRTPLARVASDHLPVQASIDLDVAARAVPPVARRRTRLALPPRLRRRVAPSARVARG